MFHGVMTVRSYAARGLLVTQLPPSAGLVLVGDSPLPPARTGQDFVAVEERCLSLISEGDKEIGSSMLMSARSGREEI
jgi:hypothetical protein